MLSDAYGNPENQVPLLLRHWQGCLPILLPLLPLAPRFMQVIFSRLQEVLQMQFSKVDPSGFTDEVHMSTLCIYVSLGGLVQ